MMGYFRLMIAFEPNVNGKKRGRWGNTRVVDCLNPDFEDGKDVSELRWAGFLRIWETLGR